MNIDEYMVLLTKAAKDANLELTENAHNIARFRAMAGIDMDKCPCERDATDRGCIGPKCWEEIKRDGRCLCNCFRRKHDN